MRIYALYGFYMDLSLACGPISLYPIQKLESRIIMFHFKLSFFIDIAQNLQLPSPPIHPPSSSFYISHFLSPLFILIFHPSLSIPQTPFYSLLDSMTTTTRQKQQWRWPLTWKQKQPDSLVAQRHFSVSTNVPFSVTKRILH